MDFYAVLPSNASPEIFPQNTTSNFKVQLSERMELHGNWQLALLEIHYPNTLSQIDKGENWIKVFKPFMDSPDTQALTGPTHDVNTTQTDPVSIYTSEDTYNIKPGYYTTTHDLILALHEALTSVQALPNDRGRSGIFEVTSDNYLMIHPFSSCTNCTYQFAHRLALQLGLSHAGPYKANKPV